MLKNMNSESKNRFLIYQSRLAKQNNLESILIYAVKANDLLMVEELLKNKVDPSYINMNSKYGTALTIAVQNSNLQIIKILLSIKEIDLNIYYKDFKTPLILAAYQLNEKIVNFIINNNDSKNNEFKFKTLHKIINLNCIDPNIRVLNNTILTYACKYNLINIVKNLLQNDSIDVNLNIPKTGDTPLITSIKYYNDEITKMLINHPKTNINLLNYKRKSAFIYAAKLNQNEIVNLILNSKSNMNEKLLFLSSLKKFKHYFITQYSNESFHPQKMIHENTPITILPKRNHLYEFIIEFPNILSNNLNDPIVSPEFRTGDICEKFIIDFEKKSFTLEITDFYRGSFLVSKIFFLNQNKKLSNESKLSFLYCESQYSGSITLPFSKEDLINPNNGWTFHNSLKIKVNLDAYSKNILYLISLNKTGDFNYTIKFLIPISIFNQERENKTIDFPPVEAKLLIIKPSINFNFDENKIKIQTSFKINNGNDLFTDLIFYYENVKQDKNFYAVFPNVESDFHLKNHLKMMGLFS